MRKRRTNTIALFALFAVIAISSPAYAQSEEKIVRGQVIGIVEGDTLTVAVDSKQVRVRLAEIDAPETKQPFGNRSKKSLSDLCFWVEAELTIRGKDQYGRKLARVVCNGVDANAEQVKRGMAWVFDKYAKDPVLFKLQDEARTEKRGLWSDKNSIPPWEWRKTHR
jgi:endonuclease YncB( thermonuclease family)